MKQDVGGDVLDVGAEATLDLSVVCPFYNEEQIVGTAITALAERLDDIDARWELIVVNDGSKDGSLEAARKAAAAFGNVRVISYAFNRGRGHALRTGIAQARGEIVVTTEIDLSWGEDIVSRLYSAIRGHPDVDIVVASPHLPGGGYKNVPAKRVFFSQFGNWVIRALMANAVSMNTGMTRAYRRDSIWRLPLEEDRKEFHLEVILKAQALGYHIHEIPSQLEWKEYKHQGQRVERKSSSKVNKLVITHSLFSLFANPMRYALGLAGLAGGLSGLSLLVGAIRWSLGLVSVFMLIVSLGFAILGLLLFAFGVLAQQNSRIQRELWVARVEMDELRRAPAAPGSAPVRLPPAARSADPAASGE